MLEIRSMHNTNQWIAHLILSHLATWVNQTKKLCLFLNLQLHHFSSLLELYLTKPNQMGVNWKNIYSSWKQIKTFLTCYKQQHRADIFVHTRVHAGWTPRCQIQSPVPPNPQTLAYSGPCSHGRVYDPPKTENS